jgi:hypothetical protein
MITGLFAPDCQASDPLPNCEVLSMQRGPPINGRGDYSPGSL